MGSDHEPEEQESGEGTAGGCDALPDVAHDNDGSAVDTPAWADGLKDLYRSVVDEPLPDSFKDLLDQFDETGEDGAASDPGNPA